MWYSSSNLIGATSRKPKEAVIASLRDQGNLICGLARDIDRKQGNVSNPLSPEVLCLPSEQVEEARKTISNLHLEVVDDPTS
jgi:hypothetical protein